MSLITERTPNKPPEIYCSGYASALFQEAYDIFNKRLKDDVARQPDFDIVSNWEQLFINCLLKRGCNDDAAKFQGLVFADWITQDLNYYEALDQGRQRSYSVSAQDCYGRNVNDWLRFHLAASLSEKTYSKVDIPTIPWDKPKTLQHYKEPFTEELLCAMPYSFDADNMGNKLSCSYVFDNKGELALLNYNIKSI